MTHPPCVGCDDPSSPCSCRRPTLRVGQATAGRQGGAAVGAVFLLRNMTQRSRRAGTAQIKRNAEPAGIAILTLPE